MFSFRQSLRRPPRFATAAATATLVGGGLALLQRQQQQQQEESELQQRKDDSRSNDDVVAAVAKIKKKKKTERVCYCEQATVPSPYDPHPLIPTRSTAVANKLRSHSTRLEQFDLKKEYDILQVLGEGGYGMVYRARRKSDGRIVALKTMPREFTGKTEFEREVAALQLLANGNDHIVKLFAVHRDKTRYYLAMELIEGGELLDHLMDSGPFSEGLAASFLRQFAEAIAYTHSIGLVHADLKPENLMLSSKDVDTAKLKVVDFGCAASHDESKKDSMLLPAEEFAIGCSFLHMVALGNQFEMEQMLLKKPSLINFRDYDFRTPLHLAASEGHVDICRFLVAKGARINRSDRWGGSPLDDAHRHRHSEVIEYLRKEGAKFGSTSAATKFIEAASAGDKEEVVALLEFGNLDINQGDYDRRTALHLAAGEGRLEVVDILCKAGANVNVEDRWGNRPLDDAIKAKKNARPIMNILEDYGAKHSGTCTASSQQAKTTLENKNKAAEISSGTIAYWPPELFVVEGAVPSPATDMWAAGVIMYVLLTCSHPFDKNADQSDEDIQEVLEKMGGDPENQMRMLNELVFDERVEGLSPSCIELMRQLLHPDPKKRMTSENFLRHPWIQGLTASWTTLDKTHHKHLQKRFKKNILKRFGGSTTTTTGGDRISLRDIFNAIDIDGDGVLDPNEIRIVLRSSGEPEDAISKIVASLEFKRHGGRVQGVSWDAFQKLMSTSED